MRREQAPESVQIEAIEVHHLDPGRDEVLHELLASRPQEPYTSAKARKLRVRAEDQVDARAGPPTSSVLRSRPSYTPSTPADGCHSRVHVEQVDEEVVRQRARARFVKTPCLRPAGIRAEHAQAADAAPSSPARSTASSCARSTSASSGCMNCACCGSRSCGSHRPVGSSGAKDSTSVCSCEASMRPGREGHCSRLTPAFARGLLDARRCRQHDQVGERHSLAALRLLVEVRLDRLQLLQHLRELRRLVDLPVLLRREADARAVRAAALVRTAEGRRRRPGRRDRARRPTGPMPGSSPSAPRFPLRRSACGRPSGIGSCQISVSFGTSGPR